MLHRLARSPIFLTAVVLVWCLAGVLAVALFAPPPRSIVEPTALAGPADTPFDPGALTATVRAVAYRVANTGGEGVFLRRTPNLADRLVAWPDGTRLQSLGEAAIGDGVEWQKVRDPRGNVGYVPTRYLARE
ncbi:MAG TPA: SH3 domain-containing protein [Chloroflexota bacterium]|jgi:hypothetical protein